MNPDQIIPYNRFTSSNKKQSKIRWYIFLLFKRIFDILVGLFGCLVFAPLALVIKVANIMTGDFNSIWFIQERIGKDGEIFYMFKFRTMVPNAEELLQKLLETDEEIKKEYYENRKLNNDPRITKLGKFLRKTSLDEIPQLLNVIKGEMSFVGPRPVVIDEVENYGKNKMKFLGMKPGLTGYWACNGRSSISYKERMKLELYYIDHASILLDIKIIILTFAKVITGDGAQ